MEWNENPIPKQLNLWLLFTSHLHEITRTFFFIDFVKVEWKKTFTAYSKFNILSKNLRSYLVFHVYPDVICPSIQLLHSLSRLKTELIQTVHNGAILWNFLEQSYNQNFIYFELLRFAKLLSLFPRRFYFMFEN